MIELKNGTWYKDDDYLPRSELHHLTGELKKRMDEVEESLKTSNK